MIEGEYKGPIVDGVREGQGVVKWKNGDVYTGEFRFGLRQGKGVYVTQKGLHTYDGDWKGSLKHGFGVEYWPNMDKVK